MSQKSTDWNTFYRLHLKGNQAISALRFFYPNFVEMEGSIFLEEQLSTLDYGAVKNRVGANKEALEKAINDVDFTDIIDWDLSDKELHEFVQQVCTLWKQKLREEFPMRHFRVEIVDFSGDGAWGITFFESKD